MNESSSPLGFVAPEPSELAALLPGYEIYNLIAAGGMGAVYAALQKSLDRPVAIKILPTELSADHAFRSQFEDEAKAMARLNHANLIGVYDFGEVAGMLFIVMEYVEGESLYQSARGIKIDPAQAVDVVLAVAEGLAHAHKAGLVHRDVKPANILLTQEAVPKIGDFGLAARSGEDGICMGTPDYLAPEVLARPDLADQRGDIFSTGVILYELLTGSLPRKGKVYPSDYANVNAGMDRICAISMHPDPAARYQRIEDLISDLKAWRSGSAKPAAKPALRTEPSRVQSAKTPPVPAYPSKPKGSNLALKLVLIACLLAAIYYVYQEKVRREDQYAQLQSKPKETSPVAEIKTVPDSGKPPQSEPAAIPTDRVSEMAGQLAREKDAQRDARGDMDETASIEGTYIDATDIKTLRGKPGEVVTARGRVVKARKMGSSSMINFSEFDTDSLVVLLPPVRPQENQITEEKLNVLVGKEINVTGMIRVSPRGDTIMYIRSVADVKLSDGDQTTWLSASVSGTPKKNQAIPDGATYFNGKWYRVYEEVLSWSNAQAKCREIGGQLVVIPNLETQNFVVNLLQGQESWLGATDQAQEGTWIWSDGSKMTFQNFAKGNPDNAESKEHFLTIWKDGRWNDIFDVGFRSNISRYICEWPDKRDSDSSLVKTSQDDGRAAGTKYVATLPGGEKMTFSYCPPGTFTLRHPVRLTQGFWLATTETTQDQWHAVMGNNPSHFKGGNLPVETVSWTDAEQFIANLNSLSGLPAGWKWALPTEAQWVYACRAGTTTEFSFGNALSSQDANFNGKSPYGGAPEGPHLEKTTAVGSYSANPWGLYDMHGNVQEWCADWYEPGVDGIKGDDPSGPLTGGTRVFRGGDWNSPASTCRVNYRSRWPSNRREPILGFRPALVPVPLSDVIGSPPVLAYTTGFEAPEFKVGSFGSGTALETQSTHWSLHRDAVGSNLPRLATIQTSVSKSGSQALAVHAEYANSIKAGISATFENQAKSIIIEADIFLASSSDQSVWQFAAGDKTAGFVGGINIAPDNGLFQLITPGFKKTAPIINRDTWYRLGLVFDLTNQTYQVIVDRKVIADEVPFHNPAKSLGVFQFDNFSKGNDTAYLDNFSMRENIKGMQDIPGIAANIPRGVTPDINAILDWSNTEGTTIQGKFVKFENNKVVILKDRKQVTLPFEMLSDESQAQARALAESIRANEPVVPEPVKPAPTRQTIPDHQRKLAEVILSKRGSIEIWRGSSAMSVSRFEELPNGFFELKSLFLAEAPFTDEDALLLVGCDKLDSVGFSLNSVASLPLNTLKNLSNLTFDRCRIRADTLDTLGENKQLRNISLWRTPVANAGGLVKALASSPDLYRISFAHTGLSGTSLEPLTKLKSLSQLYLDGTRLTGLELSPIRDMKSLEILGLSHCDLKDLDFRIFPSLKTLRELYLGGCKLPIDALTHLAGMRSLSRLELGSSDVDPIMLKTLGEMRELKYLGLDNTKTSARDILGIKPLRSLQEISLRGKELQLGNDGIIAMLETFPNVAVVNIDASAVGPLGYARLGDFNALRDLRLADAGTLPDASIEALSRLRNIKLLDLSHSAITEDQFGKLLTMKNGIENLTLSHTRISGKIIPHLLDMKSLKYLYITGTDLTGDQVALLRKEMPQCQIFY